MSGQELIVSIQNHVPVTGTPFNYNFQVRYLVTGTEASSQNETYY